MTLELVDDAADPRLDPFRAMTDSALRVDASARTGLYLAESLPVLQRAIAAGHRVRGVLTHPRKASSVAAILPADTPVLLVSEALASEITGYAAHRGVIAAVERPGRVDVATILHAARTVIIADEITDATNLGAIFRAAAGLGADGVLITPGTADPLYRRAIRVSMGTVFQVPWARTGGTTALLGNLREAGFETAALALSPGAVDLRSFRRPARLGLILGAEGQGLRPDVIELADHVVTIPMAAGVDSLNVGAAAAIALWAMTDGL